MTPAVRPLAVAAIQMTTDANGIATLDETVATPLNVSVFADAHLVPVKSSPTRSTMGTSEFSAGLNSWGSIQKS